jgi:hypothetical protein
MLTRWFRTRARLCLSLAFLGCLLMAVTLSLMLPRERVTLANLKRIELGMSKADVCRLLGAPRAQTAVLGIFRDGRLELGPIFYSSQELHRLGYHDYTQLGWASPEMTILVIVNVEGLVVARTSLDRGSSLTWFDELRLWVSRFF